MIRALHIHGLYMISAGVLIGACMESFYTISESLIWMVFLIGFLFLIYGLLKKKQTYILVMLFFFSFAVILFRFHDEKDFYKAQVLTRLFDNPSEEGAVFPRPFGVFYTNDRPIYENMMAMQIEEAMTSKGMGDLDKLIRGRETWEIK